MPPLYAFFLVGLGGALGSMLRFLGGFTTFSAFSIEVAGAYRGNDLTSLSVIGIATVCGSVLAALVGMAVGLALFYQSENSAT